jgi:hypothetical protein
MDAVLGAKRRCLTPDEACTQAMSSLNLPAERRSMFLTAVNNLYAPKTE